MADLLGFSKVVAEHSLDNAIGCFREFCNQTKSSTGARSSTTTRPKISFMSDSAFIYIDWKDRQNFDKSIHTKLMITQLSNIMLNSIHGLSRGDSYHLVPMRASFSFDEYLGGENFPVCINVSCGELETIPFGVVGKAVVRAHDWEKKQKWLGASFTPETYEYMNSNMRGIVEELKKDNLIVEYDVPVECKGKKKKVSSYAVNFNYEDRFDGLYQSLDEKEREHTAKNNTSISAKYRATKDFLVYCRDNDLVRRKNV